MKSLSLLILSFLSINFCLAQEKEITGTVSEGGQLMPNVNVLIKNTNTGTQTDFDGNYTIMATPEDVLVFSYIGFKSQEILVGNQTIISVNLSEDVDQLDEIVLIGYGASKKKDLTGAVSSVDGEELEKRTVTNIQQALAGQLPGVQVSSGSGAPGSEAQITVRGFSTLNNNSPLFVVDDVPLDDISFISPNDVESIQVLKDASATAIYGSRASNGVIIITTKKGKGEKLSISLNSYSSFQFVAKKPALADATEYAKIINQASINDGNLPPYSNPENFGAGTDWFDVVTQQALLNNTSLNINGGSELIKVSSGLSYQDQDGIEKGGDFKRLTARLNSEFRISENFTIKQNFSFGQSTTVNGPGLIWDALRLEPITNPYLPIYEQPAALNEFSIFSPTITDVPNALARLARNFNVTDYLEASAL